MRLGPAPYAQETSVHLYVEQRGSSLALPTSTRGTKKAETDAKGLSTLLKGRVGTFWDMGEHLCISCHTESIFPPTSGVVSQGWSWV